MDGQVLMEFQQARDGHVIHGEQGASPRIARRRDRRYVSQSGGPKLPVEASVTRGDLDRQAEQTIKRFGTVADMVRLHCQRIGRIEEAIVDIVTPIRAMASECQREYSQGSCRDAIAFSATDSSIGRDSIRESPCDQYATVLSGKSGSSVGGEVLRSTSRQGDIGKDSVILKILNNALLSFAGIDSAPN